MTHLLSEVFSAVLLLENGYSI